MILTDFIPILDHAHLVGIRHGQFGWSHEIDNDFAKDLESIRLGMHRASVQQVPNESDMNLRVVPLALLQKGKFIQIFLRRMFVSSIAGVQKDGRFASNPRRPVGQLFLHGKADTFCFRAHDKDGPTTVSHEHFDGIENGFLLGKTASGCIEDIEFDIVEIGGCPE